MIVFNTDDPGLTRKLDPISLLSPIFELILAHIWKSYQKILFILDLIKSQNSIKSISKQDNCR